jgi:hypothetical protein
MATKRTFTGAEPVSQELEDFRALQARLLAGAAERIYADMERARELGIIDEHGNLISEEWPAEMRPTESSTGAPLNPDDYDWRF